MQFSPDSSIGRSGRVQRIESLMRAALTSWIRPV
jgi:hypothetical protein